MAAELAIAAAAKGLSADELKVRLNLLSWFEIRTSCMLGMLSTC